MRLTPILATALAAFSTLTADAALITWGAPQAISGDSDVVTTGSFLQAFNFGPVGVSSTTINGVTFTGATFAPGVTTTTALPLSSAPADRPVVLGLACSTIGESYQIQFWVNNSGRTFFAERGNFPTTISDGLGNEVSLYPGDNGIGTGPGGSNLPPALGQYVVGTFTADADFQNFPFFSGEISGVVNGFQVRTLPASVPKPGTALAGLALVGLCGTMRRRR